MGFDRANRWWRSCQELSRTLRSSAHALAADDKAVEVWRAVAERIFWKPNEDPRYQNEFDIICQQDVFERRYQA